MICALRSLRRPLLSKSCHKAYVKRNWTSNEKMRERFLSFKKEIDDNADLVIDVLGTFIAVLVFFGWHNPKFLILLRQGAVFFSLISSTDKKLARSTYLTAEARRLETDLFNERQLRENNKRNFRLEIFRERELRDAAVFKERELRDEALSRERENRHKVEQSIATEVESRLSRLIQPEIHCPSLGVLNQDDAKIEK